MPALRAAQAHSGLGGLGEAVSRDAWQVRGPALQGGDMRQERLDDVQADQQAGDGGQLAADQRAELGSGDAEDRSGDDDSGQHGAPPGADSGTWIPGRRARAPRPRG